LPDARHIYDVFISNARADRELAAQLADRLQRRGLEVWQADQALAPGERWRQPIKEAVDGARLGLVILSRATDASQPMLSAEWMALVESRWQRPDLAFCTLRLGDVEIPPFLRGWQTVQLSSRQPKELDRAANMIADYVRNPQKGPSEDSVRREQLRVIAHP
jgi:hypothetical protein